MAKQKVWHGPVDYQIKVKGNLGSQWSDWFEGMTIESEGAVTTITGKVLTNQLCTDCSFEYATWVYL